MSNHHQQPMTRRSRWQAFVLLVIVALFGIPLGAALFMSADGSRLLFALIYPLPVVSGGLYLHYAGLHLPFGIYVMLMGIQFALYGVMTLLLGRWFSGSRVAIVIGAVHLLLAASLLLPVVNW